MQKTKSAPLKIALPYILLGLVYITFSDRMVDSLFHKPNTITAIQTYKGYGFVLVTGIMLFFLSRHYINALTNALIEKAQNDAFYRTLVVQSSDLVLLTNGAGIVKYVGPNIERLLGYSQNEFTGKNVFDYLPTEYIAPIEEIRDDSLRNPGKSIKGETLVRHKDGTWIWVEGNVVNRMEDPTIGGLLINVRDISERKTAEEKIADSELHFKAAFEQVAVGMTNFNLAGVPELINEQFVHLTGYTRERLRSMKYWDLFPLQEQQGARSLFESVVSANTVHPIATTKVQRADGTVIWVEQLLTLIRDSQGNSLYVSLAVKDIDQSKRTEDELKYKTRELDTFIYRSSHDLRGPITTLIGLAELGIHDNPEATATEYLSNCRDVATKMEKTLDDLMAITQIKQWEPHYFEFSPERIIDNALRNGHLESIMGNTNFVKEVTNEYRFCSDETLFGIVVTQLLANAAIFRRGTPEHRVYVNVSSNDKAIHLTVMDNGIGIPAENLNKVFDLHFRGDESSRGSGIGLYLVKSAVDKLNGKIELESVRGGGTRVHVTLPNEKTNALVTSRSPMRREPAFT
ncbi:MAG: PAS domain-containing sensor histidine kinase [Flavipsychrobacter sp.]|nr:PAS domain-containing sensor histidine kinase [Flavipsychrobacter sp.]